MATTRGATVTRRERQEQEIVSALARGHFARVLVLAEEHLAEFPDDQEVRAAAAEAARVVGYETPEP
jgi:hypothetical protein